MKLKQFSISSGGKITPASPIVIDFSKSKYVGLKADQEAGKTTTLDLFLMVCGQLGGDQVIEDLKNKTTGAINAELTFIGNDKAEYEVKRTEKKLEVRRNGEVQGSPVELLKKMLGVVGMPLMNLKDADIDDIIKCLASYSTRGVEEFKKEMDKIKKGMRDAKNARAAANKSAKGLKEYLTGEGVMNDKGEIIEGKWKANEEKYKKKVDVKSLSEKLDAAGAKSDKYLQNETKVKGQRDRKKQIEDQLKVLNAELETVDKNIAVGDKWLSENKNAKKEYDEIREQYDNVSKEVIAYDKWQDTKKKKKEMDEFEDLSVRADGNEKALIKKQQELQSEIIPEIRGLELVLEDTHEDEGEQRKAGLYYNKLNSRQQSMSQWCGVVAQLQKKQKTKIFIIDNVSDLGSKYMEIVEGLVKDGCYVLYAEMKRGQQTIEIEYN